MHASWRRRGRTRPDARCGPPYAPSRHPRALRVFQNLPHGLAAGARQVAAQQHPPPRRPQPPRPGLGWSGKPGPLTLLMPGFPHLPGFGHASRAAQALLFSPFPHLARLCASRDLRREGRAVNWGAPLVEGALAPLGCLLPLDCQAPAALG